jgi:Family of unknown function (DUF5995)
MLYAMARPCILLKRLIPACIFAASSLQCQSQVVFSVNDSLLTISQQPGISKYFGTLYYKSALAADTYALKQHTAAAQFLQQFKKSFARYFFSAVSSNALQQPQTFSWQRYYANAGLNELQYYFLGMNAHINGDMWQGIVTASPYDSIKKYEAVLMHFQTALNPVFDSIYYQLKKKQHSLLRFHILSFGADRFFGKKMMRHWRKNQIKLALLYYTHTNKFTRRLNRTHKKMLRMDAFVIKHFT